MAPTPPGLQFTERMKGWFSASVGDRDYQGGWDRGRADGSPLRADLTIVVDNLTRLLDDRAGSGRLEGTVLAPKLSPHPLKVTDGEVRLFERDPQRVETWDMRYLMRTASVDGGHYRFEGVKVLHDDPGFDVWKDTTTLSVRILDEDDSASAAGVLRLSAINLFRQLRTLKVTGVPDAKRRRQYLLRFLAMFAKRLVHIYGPLDEDGRFWRRPVTRGPIMPKEGRTPDLVLWCDGQDNWHDDGTPPGRDAWLRLTRFKGGDKGPVMLVPGFAMSARSYAMRTNQTNFVAYLLDNQYDVWLFDYRACIELDSAKTLFTLDDIARKDWRLAVSEVLHRTGREQEGVQVVGHCVGSVTFLMAMAAGLTGVRSAVCSQFTMYPRSWWFNVAKTPAAQLLRPLGIHSLSPDTDPTLWNKLLDIALWPLPVPRGERCGSALCRWLNLVYGMTHRHAQLNDETHRALVDSFGVGNLRSIEHLGLIFRKGRAVDIRSEDVYFQHPERLAIPIHFLVGKRNTMFFPDTTNETLHWLRRSNYPPSLYTYTEFGDYAHLDCFIGEKAALEVFPDIVQQLDAQEAPTPGAPETA